MYLHISIVTLSFNELTRRKQTFEHHRISLLLVMSDEYTIKAHSKKEAEKLAREKFGNDYLIDDVIVTESEVN